MSSALEFMIPAVLERRYRVWKHESLDGFALAEARVIDPRTLDLLGLGQLITTQAWVAAEVRLELAHDMNSFVRLECVSVSRVTDPWAFGPSPASRPRSQPS